MKKILIVIIFLVMPIFADKPESHKNLLKYAIEEGCLSLVSSQTMLDTGLENILVETKQVQMFVFEETFRAKDSSRKDWLLRVYHNNYVDSKKDKNGKYVFKNGNFVLIKGKFKLYGCVGK